MNRQIYFSKEINTPISKNDFVHKYFVRIYMYMYMKYNLILQIVGIKGIIEL